MFVVDFNPIVYHTLQARGIKIYYGDIAHADTLTHAGIADAEIVISSVPDSLLKGTSNEKLVRHIRAVNPTAKIIATADVLSETQTLYAAGADYVTIARLDRGRRADRGGHRGRGRACSTTCGRGSMRGCASAARCCPDSGRRHAAGPAAGFDQGLIGEIRSNLIRLALAAPSRYSLAITSFKSGE